MHPKLQISWYLDENEVMNLSNGVNYEKNMCFVKQKENNHRTEFFTRALMRNKFFFFIGLLLTFCRAMFSRWDNA